jgi:hypothetical protein
VPGLGKPVPRNRPFAFLVSQDVRGRLKV